MPGALRISRHRAWQFQNAHRLPTAAEKRSYDRKHHLSSAYGLTPAEYDAMLAEQGGRCAICRTTEAGGRHGIFQIDHAHGSGRIRGLLCWRCNIGLGSFGDDPQVLRDAVDYLIHSALRKSA